MAKSAAGNAIISVYDKNGIAEFAAGLVKLGWHVYASGGTAKEISSAA
jgi:AICAR transformylase/IMP cyclohydrolase PurH